MAKMKNVWLEKTRTSQSLMYVYDQFSRYKQVVGLSLHHYVYVWFFLHEASRHFTKAWEHGAEHNLPTHLAYIQGMNRGQWTICPRKAGGKCENISATSSLSRRQQYPGRGANC